MSIYPSLAITGGIGSGKSTVLGLFEQAGYSIINMDKIAHSFMCADSPYYLSYAQEVDQWLGSDFVHQNAIDKAWVREQLKNIPNGYDKIAHIALPYIQQASFQEYQRLIASGQKVIFEVPLLLEMNMQDDFERILVITCDKEVKKARIQARDPHLTEDMIEHRIAIQSSDENKVKIADFVLDNSGTKEELVEQFRILLPVIENILTKK